MKQIHRVALIVFSLLYCCCSIAFAQTAADVDRANVLMSEGRELIKNNHPKEAVDRFREAKRLAPNAAIVLCNLGFALERAGLYDEALVNLTQCIKIDPTIAIAWVNLAGLYQSTGDIPKAITTFEEYLRRFPNDKDAADARSILAILKDAKATNAVNNVSGDAPDYYSSVTRDGVERWTPDHFPLKVFVSAGDSAQGYQPSFDKAMRSAFWRWQQSMNNAVSFVFVNSPDGADILVRWTNDQKQIAMDGEAGDCRTKRYHGQIVRAVITMLMLAPSESIPLGDALVHWVGLHEIGHALGIAGHSVNPKDIMYSTMTYDYEQKGLSTRDLNTMHRLYR